MLKLSLNLETLFSFNFQLKKTSTELCILGHLQAIRVPKLKREKASKLNKSDLYSYRSDFCSAENLKENKDSKFEYEMNQTIIKSLHSLVDFFEDPKNMKIPIGKYLLKFWHLL